MARHKAWWNAELFSYGPRYVKGKVDGFHMTVRADDGTESGRYVDVELSDAWLRTLMGVMATHLNRDLSNDAGPEDIDGKKTGT